MKMNSDNKLILLTSNKTNMSLYNWSSNCINKSLYEIMESEHADRWHQRFNEWKKVGVISYIAYFEDDCLLGWETTIEIVNDILFGIGKRVYKSINDGNEFFNHYYVQQEDFFVITLILENDTFIIESVETNSSLDLSNFLGKDVSRLTSFCSNILDKSVYKKCIQYNKVIHHVENFKYNGAQLFLDVILYPYLENSKVLICARIVDEKSYHKIMANISCIDDISPVTNIFGICQIYYQDKNKPYIVGCNYYFKSIIEETSLELNHIVNNHVFRSCVQSEKKESGSYVLQNKLREKLLFTITVKQLSLLNKNIYSVELTPDGEYVEDITSILIHLSPREKEILTYVAEGYTNRYISSKLSISEGTVKKTIYNAFKKIGITSRIELIRLI